MRNELTVWLTMMRISGDIVWKLSLMMPGPSVVGGEMIVAKIPQKTFCVLAGFSGAVHGEGEDVGAKEQHASLDSVVESKVNMTWRRKFKREPQGRCEPYLVLFSYRCV
jgi:hypothetical protein